MNLYQYSKISKIIISIILVLIIIKGFYLAVYNSYSKESNNFTIGLTLMTIAIFILPSLWFKFNIKKSLGLLSILIFIVIYISLEMTKGSFINQQLDNGISTTANVIKLKSEIRGKSTLWHYVIIKYTADNREILHSIYDYDQIYKKNDSIKIKYSKGNPEIFKIVDNN
jgi:glycerol uptake facilitator-like aquaporin